MKPQSKLQKVATREAPTKKTASVVTLLLRDHGAMRKLMNQVRSKRASRAQVFSGFHLLEELVRSHVAAEVAALLERVKENPRFEAQAIEGIEEHEIHKHILDGIHGVRDPKRKSIRMKIFCEILEQHLDEEEEELFPQFQKYAALSTRQKLGADFLKTRTRTRRADEHLGAVAGQMGTMRQ